jgi:hypothetical protein
LKLKEGTAPKRNTQVTLDRLFIDMNRLIHSEREPDFQHNGRISPTNVEYVAGELNVFM